MISSYLFKRPSKVPVTTTTPPPIPNAVPITNSATVPDPQEAQDLLVKQFNDLNIQIYGTYENPLVKARDIGDLLEIRNVRDTIANFDDECKVLIRASVGQTGRSVEQWFLTEDGIYELLSVTKKPLGKQFRRWVRQVMKEIRRTGEYRPKENNNRLLLAKEQLEQQKQLLEQQAAEARLQLEEQTRVLQNELQAKESELQHLKSK
ncbi:hypothetical protein HK102_011139, partial [Quaeritorhiza haematococci]